MYVDPSRNEVMQTSLDRGGVAVTDSNGVDVRLKGKGKGPVIAGYKTKKYKFTANGQPCGMIYASKKLLKNSAVRRLFESMRTMQAQSRQMMQGMGGFMDLCEQANLFLTDALEEVGVPLRIQGPDGRVESEVIEVVTKAKFPAGHYDAPAGMTRVEMQHTMPKTMEQMPNMDELLQQMGQDGQIPEDLMDQLKQLPGLTQ